MRLFFSISNSQRFFQGLPHDSQEASCTGSICTVPSEAKDRAGKTQHITTAAETRLADSVRNTHTRTWRLRSALMICQTSSSVSARPGSSSPPAEASALPPPRVRSTADSSWAEETAHTAVGDRLGSLPLSTPALPAAAAARLLTDDAVRGVIAAALSAAAAEVEPRLQLPAPLTRPGQAKHVATAVVAAAAAK